MDEAALSLRFDYAQAIAREAGQVALARFVDPGSGNVRSKQTSDNAVKAEREVEGLIRRRLEMIFPNDGFLGAETGGRIAERLWVIHPIDGKEGFFAGVPSWCTSLVFLCDGRLEFAVVHDPNHGEVYSARRGRGASLNGEPITVSSATTLRGGIVGVGYRSPTDYRATLTTMSRVLAAGGRFHHSGSGVLALAHVAHGRLLGYFEPSVNIWDCLAGSLLVREAGGVTNEPLPAEGTQDATEAPLDRGKQVFAAAPGVAQIFGKVTGVKI